MCIVDSGSNGNSSSQPTLLCINYTQISICRFSYILCVKVFTENNRILCHFYLNCCYLLLLLMVCCVYRSFYTVCRCSFIYTFLVNFTEKNNWINKTNQRSDGKNKQWNNFANVCAFALTVHVLIVTKLLNINAACANVHTQFKLLCFWHSMSTAKKKKEFIQFNLNHQINLEVSVLKMTRKWHSKSGEWKRKHVKCRIVFILFGWCCVNDTVTKSKLFLPSITVNKRLVTQLKE